MNPISTYRPAPLPVARDSAVHPAPPDPTPPAPNPSLRIDPALGMVVFEVREPDGKVVRSVPTQRELDAYRAAALRGGETPPAPSDQKPQTPRGEAEE